MSKTDDILKSVAEWEQRLKSCHYVGEIYLSEQQLRSLAGELIRKRRNVQISREQYATALVVLAVNCAYHYYDDEGFWPHFHELLGTKNTYSVNEVLGQTIEKKLELLGLLRIKRKGPFRYVGAILEQSGVSRRYIPSMARIIRELRHSRDWNDLLTMEYHEFQRVLEGIGCSRYLKSFLLDTEGWRFTVQVCQLLQYYEQGLLELERLREVPGFQPGFWDEFIRCFYSGVTVKHRKPGNFFKPRLCFFPEEKRLGLIFPSPQYIVEVTRPAAIKSWNYPVTFLDRVELWSEKYSGCIHESNGRVIKWEIDGWVPDGLPAIFDVKRRFMSRGCTLYPGEYYLLYPEGCDLQLGVIKELGRVHLPGGWEYLACQVKIDETDVIPGYNIRTGFPDSDIELRWVNPEKSRLKWATSSLDVFTGGLPEIEVSDFSAIENSNVALFYNTSFGSGRIRTRKDLKMFLHECNQRAPLTGHVWAVNLSRHGSSGTVNRAELEFCLFPQITINHETRLYGFNEEAILSFEGTECRIQMKNCKPLSRDGKRWLIPGNVDVAEGLISCGEVVTGIKVQVHRARIYNHKGEPVRYLFLAELENGEANFTLTGYPGKAAKLVLGRQTNAWIDIEFDSSGCVMVSSGQLLALVRSSDSQVNEIYIRCDGVTVGSGAVIIDLKALKDRVHEGKPYSISVSTARNLKKIIDLCNDLCRKGISRVLLNRIPGVNTEFDEWVVSILACASVLDNTEILVGGKPVDWIERIRNKKLKGILRLYDSGQSVSGVQQISSMDLEHLPGVGRWKEAVRKKANIYTPAGILPSVREWGGQIKKGRVPLTGMIACQPGGNILSMAWTQYFHTGNAEGVTELLHNVSGTSPVVRDLRDFLLTLMLLRQARFRSAEELISSSNPGNELAPLFSLLEIILAAVSGQELPPATGQNLQVIEALPLRQEDRKLLEVAALVDRQSEKLLPELGDTGDWLLLLFLLSSTDSVEARNGLASSLLAVEETIPSSPEWTAVENIKKFKGGKH